MTNEINWDEATTSNKYVAIEEGNEKTLVLTNHRLVEETKFDERKIFFKADCIEEDGERVEKLFDTSSNRLKKRLRPIFEKKQSTDKVKITILKLGDKFDTQYKVVEVKNEE